MNSKPKNKLLNSKDYLFLTICLILFFIGGTYFSTGGNFPTDINFYYIWIPIIIVAIPIIIYVLKNIK